MSRVTRRTIWLGGSLVGVAAFATQLTTEATTASGAGPNRAATPTPKPAGTPPPPTPTTTIPPLVITSNSPLPAGNVGTNYASFPDSSGGRGTPHQWSLIAGSLPAGLSMASFFGVQSTIIAGTPTQVQTTTL